MMIRNNEAIDIKKSVEYEFYKLFYERDGK